MSTANITSQVQDVMLTAMIRELQQDSVTKSRGRTVLTILYLCVLGLCFLTPVFYYIKMHFYEERLSERSREQENDMIRASLEQTDQHRDEARATRRKYIVERRARILQLFEPVRMVSSCFLQIHTPIQDDGKSRSVCRSLTRYLTFLTPYCSFSFVRF
jgi:p-aminobenzoyl-glutamate transporter AbgT